MINEIIEVQKYLDGKDIKLNNLFRTCYLLAKYYKEQDKSLIEIREAIFSWANQNNIFIKYNLNGIISSVMLDKKPLTRDIVVHISKDDVNEIIRRFDTKNTRLTALAMLCYSKVYADANKAFQLSSTALGAWIKIPQQHVGNLYIRELVDFEYVERIEETKKVWNKTSVKNGKATNYKLCVDYDDINTGEYILINNDIYNLYKTVFNNQKDK